jgi:hypothetical protein
MERMSKVPPLRLRKLADRTPVKFAMNLTPELYEGLARYSKLYEETYGVAEPLSELVPAMLAAFLESDRAFLRSRKSGPLDDQDSR